MGTRLSALHFFMVSGRRASRWQTAVRPASRNRPGIGAGCAVLAALLLMSSWAAAAATPGGEPESPVNQASALAKEWNAELARFEKQLGRADLSDDRLDELRARMVELQAAARAQDERLAPELKAARAELDALGPPPTADSPAEVPTIAARRRSFTERVQAAEGVGKETQLLASRLERMLARISELKRLRFTERIMTRGLSPMSPVVWRQSADELAGDLADARSAFADWRASEQAATELATLRWSLPLGLLGAVLLAWPLRIWLIRQYGYLAIEGEPSYGQRLRTALFTGFVRPLIPTAAVLAVYLSLSAATTLAPTADAALRSAVVALIGNFFVVAFCWAALAPDSPSWRLAPVSDPTARAISRAVTALAAVFGVDWVLTEMNTQLSASMELVTLQQFLSGLTIAGLLFALLRRPLWQASGESAAPGTERLRGLRVPLAILVCAIPLSACLGYVALSRVLATQFVQSAGLFVLLVLLRELGDEMIAEAFRNDPVWGPRLRRSLSLSDEGSEVLVFWLKVALRLAILIAGILALPLIWGAGGNDIQAWLRDVVNGIQIGHIKLSLADLLWSIALFSGLLLATRVLQRTIDQQIFPKTRLDAGLRNSIRSAIGYVGFTIAAVLGIASLGLDLSNLALIAGALSVGIGLGLQNIVNNFVSGIILLIERPFKVGDWIVVGGQQGYVRKISVRATEIATFDRASVFVPNSELIASAVVNRTYADPHGRIIVPVGIAYGSDTQQVRRALQETATAHPEVLENPAPIVLFRGFGESALQFELVAHVRDVNQSLLVTSDLCFAIDEAFTRSGIAFPFPQRDVQMTFGDEQWERLVAALQRGVADPAPPKSGPSA
ncbi:MAG: DUF3772 domain-containing protein [Methylotetracoccus sp.]